MDFVMDLEHLGISSWGGGCKEGPLFSFSLFQVEERFIELRKLPVEIARTEAANRLCW